MAVKKDSTEIAWRGTESEMSATRCIESQVDRGAFDSDKLMSFFIYNVAEWELLKLRILFGIRFQKRARRMCVSWKCVVSLSFIHTTESAISDGSEESEDEIEVNCGCERFSCFCIFYVGRHGDNVLETIEQVL